MSRLFAVVALALLLGCQQSPTPGPAPVGSLTARLRAEADALAARGDYEAAVVKYQAAVNQEPDDVALHFALGTALSHLDRREETVEQFRFVVTRGRPESNEVQVARQWLIAAGELAASVTFAPSKKPEPPARPAATPQATGAERFGKVKGKTEGAAGRAVRMALMGDEESNVEVAVQKPSRLGESYEFENVPAGKYRLIVEDAESGDVLWEVPVPVTAGKETVLDLTSQNSK